MPMMMAVMMVMAMGVMMPACGIGRRTRQDSGAKRCRGENGSHQVTSLLWAYVTQLVMVG